MLFDPLAQAALSKQGLTKGTSGLPQQQACDIHVTEHDDAGVLTKRIIQMSHLPCKFKTVF